MLAVVCSCFRKPSVLMGYFEYEIERLLVELLIYVSCNQFATS